jgi:hypothetical protein
LEERFEVCNQDRLRINEKWLKLVAKYKVEEKYAHSKKSEEQKKDLMSKEMEMLKKKNEFYERENKYLRDQSLEFQCKLESKSARINDDKRMKEENEVLRNRERELEGETSHLKRAYKDLGLEN